MAIFGTTIVHDLFEQQNVDLCNNRNFTAVKSGESNIKNILPNPACEQKKFVSSLENKNEHLELSSLQLEHFTKLFGNCYGDWVRIGNGCYQFVHLKKSVTQNEAEDICQAKGGHLVEINTLKENDDLTNYYMNNLITPPIKSIFHSFISSFVKIRPRPTGWWTGASYNSLSGDWSWCMWDVCKDMEFVNWHEKNKHEVDTENCAAVHDETENSFYQSFGWLSLPCQGREDVSILLFPLCEK